MSAQILTPDELEQSAVILGELLASRCDACSQQAYVLARVQLPDRQERSTLMYCSHHGTLFLPKLREYAVLILDARDRLSCD